MRTVSHRMNYYRRKNSYRANSSSVKADMDIGPFLVSSLGKVLKEVTPGPIVIKGDISKKKLFKPR